MREDLAPARVDEARVAGELWDDERGHVRTKALISRGLTPSAGMSVGIAEIDPGDSMRRHRHPQAETYLVLEGTARIEIWDERHHLQPGMAMFVPPGVPHSVTNPCGLRLRFAFVFAVDSIDDVEYEWLDNRVEPLGS